MNTYEFYVDFDSGIVQIEAETLEEAKAKAEKIQSEIECSAVVDGEVWSIGGSLNHTGNVETVAIKWSSIEEPI